MTISSFTDEADAIRQANDTDYGLAASVWTKDIDCAHRTVRAIRAGTISVNSYSEGDMTVPFGGTASPASAARRNPLPRSTGGPRRKPSGSRRTERFRSARHLTS